MTVLLLDGYNLLYRSFTSLPKAITGSDDRPINAVYGLMTFLIRARREFGPAQIAFALDVPETPTFRHRLYAGYQAQRGPLGGDDADEFQRQTSIAAGLLPRLGIPVITHPGYEADDVMGSLAVAAAGRGDDAIIVSTDRDLLQLVRPGIDVATPANPPVVARTAEDVRDRLGVPPEGVTMFKALAGDASDNIPGVAGIGTKTAASLVNTYGSLDALYDSLSAVPARTARALEAQRDDAFLFLEIVTVVTTLDVPHDAVASAQPQIDETSKPRELLKAIGASVSDETEGDGTPGGIRTPDL